MSVRMLGKVSCLFSVNTKLSNVVCFHNPQIFKTNILTISGNIFPSGSLTTHSWWEQFFVTVTRYFTICWYSNVIWSVPTNRGPRAGSRQGGEDQCRRTFHSICCSDFPQKWLECNNVQTYAVFLGGIEIVSHGNKNKILVEWCNCLNRTLKCASITTTTRPMIAKPYESLFESDVIVDADFGVGNVVGSSL